MTKAELYKLIDDTIKVNPLVQDESKTRGAKHRQVLKQIVDYLETNAGGSGGGKVNFNRPITRAVPGLQGVVPGGIGDVGLENLLYPAEAPRITGFNASVSVREFGAGTAVTLSWGVQATTYPISKITVAGQAQDKSRTSGTVATSVAPNTNTTFSMSVETGEGQTVTANTGISFSQVRFWFTSGDNLLGADDNTLSNLLASKPKEFAGGRQQSRGFSLSDEYVYFAYPAAFGDASFIVGGLPNTAYTKRVFTYTNQYGFQTSFNLYRSGGKGAGSVAIQLN